MSFTYYARLEQGRCDGISTSVLDAVARALRLTEEEHGYLLQLAQPARANSPEPAAQRVRPGVQNLLDALGVPAFVVGHGMNVLGWNRLAATVFGDFSDLPPRDRNLPGRCSCALARAGGSPTRKNGSRSSSGSCDSTRAVTPATRDSPP